MAYQPEDRAYFNHPLVYSLANAVPRPEETRNDFLGRLASLALAHSEEVVMSRQTSSFAHHIPDWTLRSLQLNGYLAIAERSISRQLNLPDLTEYRNQRRLLGHKKGKIVMLARHCFRGDDLAAVFSLEQAITPPEALNIYQPVQVQVPRAAPIRPAEDFSARQKPPTLLEEYQFIDRQTLFDETGLRLSKAETEVVARLSWLNSDIADDLDISQAYLRGLIKSAVDKNGHDRAGFIKRAYRAGLIDVRAIPSQIAPLSPQQLDMLPHLLTPTAAIARSLGLSERTIKYRRAQINGRLGVSSSRQAYIAALASGLIK